MLQSILAPTFNESASVRMSSVLGVIVIFLTGFLVSSCNHGFSQNRSAHADDNRKCAQFLPSNYLPSDHVADIWVASHHRQKYWTWGYTDYTTNDEVSQGGHLYSFDYIDYGPDTFCETVEGSTAQDLKSLRVSQDVMYLLVKDSAPISLNGIAKFSNLKAIVLVNTAVRDVFSKPPASLHSIVLINSTLEARDIDHLPKM